MKTIRCILPALFCTILFSAAWTQAASSYPAISGDNTHEWITRVTFGDIDNSTKQDKNGYGDYTYDQSGMTTRVTPGKTYPLLVTIHPDAEWCDENITVFFDWNRDLDFTDAGENYQAAFKTCSPGPHTVNIRIPEDTGGGELRMRVVLRYYNPPPSSGVLLKGGEAEDYTIVVDFPAVTGDNRSEWITNVSFGGLDNATAREQGGYGDYSIWAAGKAAQVHQGRPNPLSVTISPDATWCNDNLTAFIDWNHDGDFTDDREKYVLASRTCSPGPHVVDISVPGNARPGRTPMRVTVNWLYPPPLSGYFSGEMEEYTLFVNKHFPWVMFIPIIVAAGR